MEKNVNENVNSSVNSVNFTDKTAKNVVDTIFLHDMCESGRVRTLLIISVIVAILTTLFNSKVEYKVLTWITVILLYVWNDYFNLFLQVSIYVRHVSCICIAVIIATIAVRNWLQSLILTILVILICIFILVVTICNNPKWLYVEHEESKSEQINFMRRQAYRIEQLEQKNEKIRLDNILQKNHIAEVTEENKSLLYTIEELKTTNEELLLMLTEEEQRKNAAIEYSTSLKQQLDEVLQARTSAPILNDVNVIDVEVEDEVPILVNEVKNISDRDMQILAFHKSGMSLREVAKAMNCSHTLVAKVIKKYKDIA